MKVYISKPLKKNKIISSVQRHFGVATGTQGRYLMTDKITVGFSLLCNLLTKTKIFSALSI